MTDALSFGEIDGQHVELLPARTVLSLFTVGGGPKGGDAGNGGAGGTGGPAHGKSAIFDNWFYTEGDVYITSTGATGGAAPGGAATGGAGAAGS